MDKEKQYLCNFDPISTNRGSAVLLILGVLSVLATVGIYHLMNTHDTNLTSNRSVKENIEVDMMMAEIKMYLRSKSSCRAAFGGKGLNDTADGVSFFSDVAGVYTADTNHPHLSGGARIPLYQSQLSLGAISFLLPSIEWLKNNRSYDPTWVGDPADKIYPSDPRMRTVFAVFRFDKGPALSLRGRPQIVRMLPIEVALEPDPSNKIQECYFDSESLATTIPGPPIVTMDTLWVKGACEKIFGGTIIAGMCSNTNIKGSISTDGHFCFNNINGDNYAPGDIHSKHCITSWYFETNECYLVMPVGEKIPKSESICKGNDFMVGFSVFSCGKKCAKSTAMCCKVRLINDGGV